MTDVAKLAGVSHQTVSRAVNGSLNIRPETKARVQRAIEELGYRPNIAARALVSGQPVPIGIIGVNTFQYGPGTIRRTIEEAAQGAGLLASSVSLAGITPSLLADAIEHLTRHCVGGIIVIAGQQEALDVVRAYEPSLPLVVVEGELASTRWSVGVDQLEGARIATRHLLGLGHRRISHIAGPLNWTEAKARYDGWRAEMLGAGLVPGDVHYGDWSAASGYAAGQLIVREGSATAVFVANDQMAIGLSRALLEAGYRVPEDLSVVGFDDIPEAGYLFPPLTTVRQDFAAVGKMAIETLRAAMAGDDDSLPRRLVLPELVVRQSTARPSC